MTQEEVYAEARRVLYGIQDIPMSRFTFGEALFLFRYCMRSPGEDPNIVANFSEEDLLELVTIAHAVVQRAGPNAIH